MIAKSIKAQSFGGCVKYVMNRRCEREQSSLLELPSREEENERSEVKEDAELLKAEGVMAISAKSMIISFELQRSTRPEIKSPAGHIPISFAPEDKERMTNEFMVKLAEEYMERMGIKDTQYIIVRHHDGDNEHLHIIYNRINNEKKLISLNNDFKRNEQVCKAMKDKYGLTYGANKFKVKREKLRGSERVKHDIYHAVREEVVYCRTIEELQERLKSRGVEIAYKYRRGTNEPQGVLFTKDNLTFKGSQIDRNFSYRGIQEMSKAMDIEWKKIDEQGILQLADDLKDGTVELKIHPTRDLHAKFYLFLPKKHTQHSDGWVIMGSSNLSDSGLGLTESPRYELNVSMKDFDDVAFCKSEFDKLWKEGLPINFEDIEEFKAQTHLGQNPTPYELYLKLLIDYFGEQVEDDFSLDVPDGFKDLKYQRDAVSQGYPKR